MHHLRSLFIVCCLLLVSNVEAMNNNAIFNKALSGVVYIQGDEGMGSGAIISKHGFVLTNWHVINDYPNLKFVTLGDGDFDENIREAILIKYNELNDLALLKLTTIPRGVDVIEMSQVMLKVGESVHALGHPKGELWSYSKGYISGIRSGYSWGGTPEEPVFKGDVYQMQTPINPGNSGGPLLNNHGNLVGINSFTEPDAQNITFAVTVEEIIRFLAS